MTLYLRRQLPVPEADPDRVRERADVIMDRAEFSDTESILDRALRWLSELISGLFDALSDGGAGWVVGVVILAGLLAAAVWLVARLRPLSTRSSGGSAPIAVSLVPGDADDQRSADAWAVEAERLAAAGRFEEALRARYRALLAGLFETGVLDDVAGRTAGEYQRELACAIPEVAPRFDELTGRFEIVWYGADEASEADVDRFTDAAEHLLAGLPT